MSQCKAIECERKSIARGMCNKHWLRWRKGKNINEKSCRDKTVEERFWEKVLKSNDDECWKWLGSTKGRDEFKYGSAWDGEKSVSAHRYSYELQNGKIPKNDSYHGLCVCHSCDTPLCVNPAHLFLGTHLDNMKDKVNKNRTTSEKTHCVHGHERKPSNLYTSKKTGFKQCRECHRIKMRERQANLRLKQKIKSHRL